MEFEFKKGEIDDIIFIKRKYFQDDRGSLTKEYEAKPFYGVIKENFKEEYISVSKKYVLRGLHFQKSPKPQGKLISVIKGSNSLVHLFKTIDSKVKVKNPWAKPGGIQILSLDSADNRFVIYFR